MKKLVPLTAVVAAVAVAIWSAAPLQAQLMAGCGLVGMVTAGLRLRRHPAHVDHAFEVDFFDTGVYTLVRKA